jgi:hypothetical protein
MLFSFFFFKKIIAQHKSYMTWKEVSKDTWLLYWSIVLCYNFFLNIFHSSVWNAVVKGLNLIFLFICLFISVNYWIDVMAGLPCSSYSWSQCSDDITGCFEGITSRLWFPLHVFFSM